MPTAAQLEVLVTADTKDAESGLNRVGNSFSSVANIAQYAIGGIVANAFTAMASAASSGLSSAITSAGDFEAGLNRLQAVAGSSLQAAGISLDDVKQKALDLGQATQYSAAEAEDAMINLAKGGVPIASVMSDATDATLALAAAGEVALAPAADIVAKQLGVWGDTGVTAAQVADQLAQAANASTVDVAELAQGLAQSGGAAKNAGVGFTDLTQTIALISPNFSSASDAGTSFKTFVQRLIPATNDAKLAMKQLGLATADGKSKFYDANGAFIGMRAAAQLLQDAVSPLTEEQRNLALTTIFGADAIRTASSLAEAGAQGFDDMGASMTQAGSAADQAAQRNQGFNFAMEQLRGSLETLGITIGTAVLPYLTDFVNGVTSGVNAVMTFVQGVMDAPDPLAAFFSQLDGILPGLGQLASDAYTWGAGIVNQLASGMADAVAAFALAEQTIAPFGNTIGDVAGKIVFAGAIALPLLIDAAKRAVAGLIDFGAWLLTVASAATQNQAVMITLGTLVGTYLTAQLAKAIVSYTMLIASTIRHAVVALVQGVQAFLAPSIAALQLIGNLILLGVQLTIGAARWIAYGVATAAASIAANGVGGTLVNVGKYLLGLLPALAGGIVGFGAWAAAAIGAAVSTIAAMLPVLLPIGLAVAAIVGLYLAWQSNWGGIRDVVSNAVNWVIDKLGVLFGGLGDILAKMGILDANWRDGWESIKKSATSAAEDTKNSVSGVFSGMSTQATGILDGLKTNGAGSLLGLQTDGVGAIAGLQLGGTDQLALLQKNGIGSLQGLNTQGVAALQGLNVTGTQNTAALNTSSSEHLRDLAATSNTSLASMFGDANSLMPGMQGVVTDQMGLMQSNTATSSDQMLTALGSAFTEMNRSAGMNVQALKLIATKTLDEVVGYMQAVVDRIKAIGPDMEAAGTYIGQQLDAGIAAGIDRYVGTVINAARNAVRKAKEAAQAEAQIQSPSRVFRDEVGVQIAAGMAQGIEAGTGLVTAASARLADAALQATLDSVNAQQDALSQLASLVSGGGNVMTDSILADFQQIADGAQQYANISSKLATDYYKLRTKQVLDIAKLESDANKLAQQSNEETDSAKKQAILDEYDLVLRQIDLLKQAQAVELAQWQEHVAAIQDTMLQAVRDSAAAVQKKLEDMARNAAKGVADYANAQSAALGKLLDLMPDDSKAADAQQKVNDLLAEQARLQQIINTADDPQLVADAQKQLVDITQQLTQAQEDYNKAVTDQKYQQAVYDHTKQLMEEAKAQADVWKSVAPQLAADYYNYQLDYIGKLADLQKKYADAQTDAQKEIIQQQIDLLKTAHDAQIAEFNAQVQQYQQAADQVAADQVALQQQSQGYLDIYAAMGGQTDAATTVQAAQQDVYNITVNAQGSNLTADEIKQIIQQALDEAARQAANRKR